MEKREREGVCANISANLQTKIDTFWALLCACVCCVCANSRGAKLIINQV